MKFLTVLLALTTLCLYGCNSTSNQGSWDYEMLPAHVVQVRILQNSGTVQTGGDVIGGAIAGGLLAGNVGAVIGGLSQANAKEIIHTEEVQACVMYVQDVQGKLHRFYIEGGQTLDTALHKCALATPNDTVTLYYHYKHVGDTVTEHFITWGCPHNWNGNEEWYDECTRETKE